MSSSCRRGRPIRHRSTAAKIDCACAISECRLPPTMFEIELTETALMQVSRDSSKCLRNMRDQGIRLAIDDFGTGYSCFDYLRHFPVSRLKIAQCFVDEITKSCSSAAVTRAAIHLGKELGLGLLAEGVETAEQVALLTVGGAAPGKASTSRNRSM